MLLAAAASILFALAVLVTPMAAWYFFRALYCFLERGDIPYTLSVSLSSSSLPSDYSQIISTVTYLIRGESTYIETQLELIHTGDEGVLGKVVHQVVDYSLGHRAHGEALLGLSNDLTPCCHHRRFLAYGGLGAVDRVSAIDARCCRIYISINCALDVNLLRRFLHISRLTLRCHDNLIYSYS